VPPPRNLKLKVRMQNTNSATNLAAAAGLPAGSGSYPYSANRGSSHGVKAGAYADGEYIHLNTDCASGQYACQAKDVCQQMTGWACQHQSYSCNGGSLGTYYPSTSSTYGGGGSSYFNFDPGYDCAGDKSCVGTECDTKGTCPNNNQMYGNICSCWGGHKAAYGMYDLNQNCGLGRFYRF